MRSVAGSLLDWVEMKYVRISPMFFPAYSGDLNKFGRKHDPSDDWKKFAIIAIVPKHTELYGAHKDGLSNEFQPYHEPSVRRMIHLDRAFKAIIVGAQVPRCGSGYSPAIMAITT